MLLPAALLGAGAAAAQTAPSPESGPPATVIVLDASSSMNAKLGGAGKLAAARTELGQAVSAYGDRLSFGLVAFGHRKASNCADSEVLAKPGELTGKTQGKLLDKIKPKGQAPIAAALSDAAKAAPPHSRLDIVLIADGGDTCDADLCSTALALKEKAQALRIHVIGFGGKEEEIKPLACVAAATGGTFVAATEVEKFKQGLAAVLDTVSGPATPAAQIAAISVPSPPQQAPAALPAGTATALPIDLEAQAQAETGAPGGGADLPTIAAEPIDLSDPQPEQAGAPAVGAAKAETAVHKSAAAPPQQSESVAPPVNRVQSVPIAPPPPPPAAAKTAVAPPPQVQRPVPVTFKALISETGPSLQSGLTWRVYASKSSPEGSGFKLLSTHREPMPTAALLPGEYLVNAAYGLSNLTRKIKVESGRSLEETFVLNTGGLKLAALLPSGERLPEGAVKIDILSDEEDQFGNRSKILANAKTGVVIRLNAGAYRLESLYGDANAVVKADVTVEPGRVTEAAIKQTGSKTTFKLVQSLGGEALTDTKWTILTSAGDVVKENAGALPTHILAPGSYAVVADQGGLSYTRKFSIESGETKQVEVVVDDGPTSPEDLKALTDPPEPPPVPTEGVVAGDGQAPSPEGGMAFDGFSPTKPADPNAPLLNPGVLLRGAR
jgi:von Willebrand factor type A domain